MLISLGLFEVPRPAYPRRRVFVRTVMASAPIARDARAEKLILGGWLVIAAKSILVIWAIDHWAVPFHPYWINLPTIAMASLVTVVYLRRNRG